MISPAEIKTQALKWWQTILQSRIKAEIFFPKSIARIGKLQSSQIIHQFESIQNEIETLYQSSKNITGVGYLVKTSDRNFRRTGILELPDSIIFETVEDYLSFADKTIEWKCFLSNYELIIKNVPSLGDWCYLNCLCLTNTKTDWTGLLKVCQFFIDNPRPQLYIRQLPIAVHTKFIEENTAIIQSLLDFLIPQHIRDVNQKRLAERYFLRYDEPLVRIRFLDSQNEIRDISIPLSEFEKFETTAQNVLMAENKMNFLTLPMIPSTIAIWSGGGFNIGCLRNTKWLLEKCIFYWGDIDEHGFQILHQLRTYFPSVNSLMMDKATFDMFQEYAVSGARNRADSLSTLTEEESEFYKFIKSLSNNRLEQEKIPQSYVEEILLEILEPTQQEKR